MTNDSLKNIISIEEFDPKNLVYGNLKETKGGGKKIPVRYNCPKRGEIPFILKTPKMSVPFGASQWPKPEDVTDESAVKYSLQANFVGHVNGFEKNPSTKMMFNKFTKMQELLHKHLVKNSAKIFGTKKSLEVVQEKCNPIIKYQKDKKTKEIDPTRDPNFKISLNRDYVDSKQVDTFNDIKVYKSTGEQVNDMSVSTVSTVFPWSSSVKGVIACYSLALVNGNISMPFRALQVKVWPGANKIVGNAFADDSDNDEDDKAPAEPNAFADNSDDDADDEEVVEEKPKPKPKKNAKKKKDPTPEPSDEEEEEEVEVEVTDDDDDDDDE